MVSSQYVTDSFVSVWYTDLYLSLDWTKKFGPNWQFFDSTAEKQQKMC